MRGVAASVFVAASLVELRRPTRRRRRSPKGRRGCLGKWSLDGSCASGFGMALKREGKVSHDEYGKGLWALADAGDRHILIIEDIRQEANRKTEAKLTEFHIAARRGTAMTLVRFSDRATLEVVNRRGQ